MSKIIPCFFFEPRGGLYTGEESLLDLPINDNTPICSDIIDLINSFIHEKQHEEGYSYKQQDCGTYLLCHDVLYNEFTLPIDHDEQKCFEIEYDDDFIVDGEVFMNS